MSTHTHIHTHTFILTHAKAACGMPGEQERGSDGLSMAVENH